LNANQIDPVAWYNVAALTVTNQYESLNPERIHGWFLHFLPSASSLILDVGSGSGRDAAWLAGKGHRVVAVEPSDRMLSEAKRLHHHPNIQWIDDRLPGLDKVYQIGLSFDVILLSAVWMHVRPSDRQRGFGN
jgi:SAM-dependent methyltransferase